MEQDSKGSGDDTQPHTGGLQSPHWRLTAPHPGASDEDHDAGADGASPPPPLPSETAGTRTTTEVNTTETGHDHTPRQATLPGRFEAVSRSGTGAA
ncbi:hypothetical protein GCM10010517_50640 [Streptosporangium fragile]|uniref:Uncharacterized protein n=1 Tax=Streptosporangium fragile TaxID=46186 RepID=A0ABP6IIB2_9ACTN